MWKSVLEKCEKDIWAKTSIMLLVAYIGVALLFFVMYEKKIFIYFQTQCMQATYCSDQQCSCKPAHHSSVHVCCMQVCLNILVSYICGKQHNRMYVLAHIGF